MCCIFVVPGVYSSASDMYAFTVVLNELLTEQVPFPNTDLAQIVQRVGTFGQRPQEFVASARDSVGCELALLIARCWDQDPKHRPTFHELTPELTHLERKAVEQARVGNHASPLTPPRAAADTHAHAVERAIAQLLTARDEIGLRQRAYAGSKDALTAPR